MKNSRIFLSENFQLLVVQFSIYLNRHVFVFFFFFFFVANAFAMGTVKISIDIWI